MAQVEAVLDLKQWGNNLGVRLPMNVARAAHLHIDQRVQVAVEDDGRVVITQIRGNHPHDMTSSAGQFLCRTIDHVTQICSHFQHVFASVARYARELLMARDAVIGETSAASATSESVMFFLVIEMFDIQSGT